MSLKAFHLFFITVSVLLAFGFGGWSLVRYADSAPVLYLGMGVLAILAGVGLIVYGVRFARKLRHVGLL